MVCISAVSQTPKCAPRSQMFNFSPKKTLHHNAKSISAVCITPLCPSPKDELCIIESNSKSSLVTVVAFKETNRRNPFRGEHIYPERKELKYNMMIYDSDSTVSCTPWSQNFPTL